MRYTVVVNETGEWDVSGATMQDALGKNSVGGTDQNLSAYTGYVEVKVFDRINTANNGNEDVVIAAMASMTPKEVCWVKVDGMTGFNFSPSDLGLSGDDAYLLTYYTQLKNITNWGQANIGNSFGMTGNVGRGGRWYDLRAYSQVSKLIVEPGVEDPVKKGWYYAPEDDSFADYYADGVGNGALYWIVTMSGAKIPAGTMFQDSNRFQKNGSGNWPSGSALPANILRNSESNVGFFSANLGEDENGDPNTIQSLYPTVEDFWAAVDAGVFREIPIKDAENPDGYYTMNWGTAPFSAEGVNYYDLTISFEKTYGLQNGERLYWVIRTDPVKLPSTNSSRNYDNKINYKPPTGGWQGEKSWDTLKIADQSNGIRKSVGDIFTVKNAKTDGTWAEYANTAEFYRNTDGGLVDAYLGADGGYTNKVNTNKGDNMRQNRDLQNSLLLVAHSPAEISSLYTRAGGNSGSVYNTAWKFAGDQYLNYCYQNGLYITWNVDVNTTGSLRGEFYLKDTLPEGVELAYVRMYQGTGYSVPAFLSNAGQIIYRATGEHDFGSDWTQWSVASNLYRQSDYWIRAFTDYYTKDNQIQMYLPNLKTNNPVTFQVVCRVTDHSPFEDSFYNNQVQLFDKNGRLVDERGAEAVIHAKSANKTALVSGMLDGDKLNSTVFPYEIAINTDAEDLVTDSDVVTVPLVDRMSSNLSVANNTLMIFRDQAKDSSDNYIWSNLLYYGGTWSNLPADSGKPWYTADAAKVGAAVGNLPGRGSNIRVSFRSALDEHGAPLLYDGDGMQMKEVVFHDLPDSTPLVLQYSVTATFTDKSGQGSAFYNKAMWEGFEENSEGETEMDRIYYQVDSVAGSQTHGALLLTKFDAADETHRLSGAEFALYRAKYREHSDGMLLWEPDAPASVRAKRYLAVYLGEADGQYSTPKGTHQELAVRRNASGGISEVRVPKSDDSSTMVWMPLIDAMKAGYQFHHELDHAPDGSIQPYTDEVLGRGRTDANGMLSYGLTANLGFQLDENGDIISENPETAKETEDRIHYNKIYVIVETKAPEGYELDTTLHFFVIPKETDKLILHGDLATGSYFYHEKWPSEVHVVSQTREDQPTYLLYMPNRHAPLSVTKQFTGSVNGMLADKTYRFGLWSETDVLADNVTAANCIQQVGITYEPEDFGWYTLLHSDASGRTYSAYQQRGDLWYHGTLEVSNGGTLLAESWQPDSAVDPHYIYAYETCGILPGHERKVEFGAIDYGTYYVYEINDAGYPITEGDGTIQGLHYYVGMSGAADSTGKVVYSPTNHTVNVTNAYYDAAVTKTFYAEIPDSEDPITGKYTFGIWYASDIETATGLPRTGAAMAAEPVELEWSHSETTTSAKTGYFRDLRPGTAYCIFELDSDGQPIAVNGMGSIDGKQFDVSYGTGNSVTTVLRGASGQAPEVTVRNVVHYFGLPSTGGAGTWQFIFAGALLMSMAGVCLLRRRRRT